MASLANVSIQAASFAASPTSASLRRGASNGSPLQVSNMVPRACPALRLRVVAMASPKADINEQLSQSIKEAEELCTADNSSGECAAAWDEVEEISAEIAHKRVKAQGEKKDPLEEFCKDSPEADECRVYED